MARVLLVVFAGLHIALALTGSPYGASWSTIAALTLIIGAASAVVLLPGFALPALWVAATLGALLIGATLATTALPVGGWPGYAAWHLGAGTFVLLGLTLRGQIAAAWAGMAGLAAECVLWSSLTGQGIWHGVDLIDRQAGTLLIGTLFALGLTRAAEAVGRLRELEQERVTEQQNIAAAEQERNDEAHRVLDLVKPTLTDIAQAQRLSPDQRASIRALEGALRDRIVAPLLQQNSTLAAAVAEARKRGVDVTLLSNIDADSEHGSLSEAIDWLSKQAADAQGQRFVARVMERGGTLRASAVNDDRLAEQTFPGGA